MAELKNISYLKIVLTVICLTGFVYQTQLLIQEYMFGNTIVTIRVENPRTETLPGVTICLLGSLLIEKVAQIDQDFSQLFQVYTSIVNNASIEEWKKKEQVKNVYFKIQQRFWNMGFTPTQYLANFSISTEGFVQLNIHGFVNEKENTTIRFNKRDNKLGFKIIESISYDRLGRIYKCFTFFSQLCEVSRNFKIHLQGMLIRYVAPTKFSTTVLFHPIVMFHSSNSFPDMGSATYLELDLKTETLFTFNQMSTQLLDSRYDTNCFEYDLDYKFANFNMRSDCITTCAQNYIINDCNVEGIPISGNVLRKKFLEHNFKKMTLAKNEKCQWESYFKSKYFCEQKCRPDCNLRYYFVDRSHPGWPAQQSFSMIIKHNFLPDVILIYLPHTTFLSLVCNFGGLMGMWLGLSFLTIFESMFLKFNTIILQKNKITSTQVFNYSPNVFVKRPKNKMSVNSID